MVSKGDGDMNKGDKVIGRDGKYVGYATGSTRRCTLEGCNGTRYYVKWNHGRTTYPCIKGVDWCWEESAWLIV